MSHQHFPEWQVEAIQELTEICYLLASNNFDGFVDFSERLWKTFHSLDFRYGAGQIPPIRAVPVPLNGQHIKAFGCKAIAFDSAVNQLSELTGQASALIKQRLIEQSWDSLLTLPPTEIQAICARNLEVLERVAKLRKEQGL